MSHQHIQSTRRGRATNIVIVEHHPAICRGLELLLRSDGHQIVGTTDSPQRAMHLMAARRPEVALVDLGLGGIGGLALARELSSAMPALGVLLYSGCEAAETLADALACETRGLALKVGAPAELLAAIAAVARGDRWLDPRLPRLLRPLAKDEPAHQISRREREVLCLLAEGMTGEAVARQLFLSPETVRTHVRNAMRKLGARTRSQAIAMIVRSGHDAVVHEPPAHVRVATVETVHGRQGTSPERA